MIRQVDEKLMSKQGLFIDEDAHNAKRQLLLARAAEAKKRLDDEAKKQGTQKRPSYEILEDGKSQRTTIAVVKQLTGLCVLTSFII